jgi:hypothetical protein
LWYESTKCKYRLSSNWFACQHTQAECYLPTGTKKDYEKGRAGSILLCFLKKGLSKGDINLGGFCNIFYPTHGTRDIFLFYMLKIIYYDGRMAGLDP